jgi:hypothetical protein
MQQERQRDINNKYNSSIMNLNNIIKIIIKIKMQ